MSGSKSIIDHHLQPDVGRPIGSVFIDRSIHKHITEQLCKVKDCLLHTPDHVAWKMLSGRFQRLKCAFGTEAARTPKITLSVPFLKDPARDLPAAGIFGGQMSISWSVLLLVSFPTPSLTLPGNMFSMLLTSRLTRCVSCLTLRFSGCR